GASSLKYENTAIATQAMAIKIERSAFARLRFIDPSLKTASSHGNIVTVKKAGIGESYSLVQSLSIPFPPTLHHAWSLNSEQGKPQRHRGHREEYWTG